MENKDLSKEISTIRTNKETVYKLIELKGKYRLNSITDVITKLIRDKEKNENRK